MSTDPVTLAREVLDAVHEDETITVCSIPDNKVAALARAVTSLTAELDAYREENTCHREKIARVEVLADRLDAEAEELHNFSGGISDEAEWLEATATRIRAALNGDNA